MVKKFVFLTFFKRENVPEDKIKNFPDIEHFFIIHDTVEYDENELTDIEI